MKQDKNKLLDEVLKILGDRYPVGLYEYLFNYSPDLYNWINQTENKVEKVFLSGSFDDLKEVLTEYWILHMRAIETYKADKHTNFDMLIERNRLKELRNEV